MHDWTGSIDRSVSDLDGRLFCCRREKGRSRNHLIPHPHEGGMAETAKAVIDRVRRHADREGITVDASFRTALASYSSLLTHAAPELHLGTSDIEFVNTVVAAKALSDARALPMKLMDATVLFRAISGLKMPPFDPDDPCEGAAKEVIRRKSTWATSDLGKTIQELSHD